jgi:uncharacterized protein involved in exopolysaccharide biosynthesis
MLWRRRWTFLVPVATLLLPATLYAVSLADVYDAKATVLVREVEPGGADSPLPREGTDRPDEVMATVRDRIFTRNNLQSVVPILAPQAETPDPRLLESLAKSFAWEEIGISSFQLIHTNTSPDRAALAVNTLLQAFLDHERAERLRRAERSRDFHAKDEKKAKERYDAALARRNEYRAEHDATLPDRKEGITSELARRQTQISTQIGLISGQRSRVQMLDDQLVLQANQITPAATGQTSVLEETLRMQLAEVNRALKAGEQALAEALATKTEKHPDVIRLRSAVEVHRAAVSTTMAALEKERREAQTRVRESSQAQLERRRKMLQSFRDSAQAALEQAEETLRSHQDRVVELQGHLAKIPETARGLEPIERELEEAEKLLRAREDAHRDARLVVDYYAEGEPSEVTGFSVTAWAAVPVETSGPGRMRYLLTAIGLGLLIGYGLLVLRHRHEGATIASPDDLAGLFPAAVVVSVPLLGSGKRRTSWRSRFAELGTLAYVVLVLGASVFLIAAHKGWVAKPEFLQGFFGGGA